MKISNLLSHSIKFVVISAACFSPLIAPSFALAEEGPFYCIEHDPDNDKYWKCNEAAHETLDSCKAFAEQIKKGAKVSPSGTFIAERSSLKYYCVTGPELSDYTLEN